MIDTLYKAIEAMKKKAPFKHGNTDIMIFINLNEKDSQLKLYFDNISNKDIINAVNSKS